MATRIVIDGSIAYVYTTYQYKDVVKGIPGKRWDPVNKRWTIPREWHDVLADVLRDQGEHVTVTDAHGKSTSVAVNPFTDLFRAVGTTGHTLIYRALSKIVHPDAGGHTELQQQLNTAYQAAGGGRG
jgi:hypothetical protein